ncbi:MAG TPA: efflux RND transporter periplasmic adaptor subunit [Polyangiaceae bacterium]|nr:efflux RND transporter periplasmic adaptor subunit [Polyangiaceae bacterium]
MKIVEKLKQRFIYLLLIGALVAVAGHEWRLFQQGKVIAVAAAKPPPPPGPIVAEGRVSTHPGGEVTIAAEFPGKLAAMHVLERDRVTAGMVLAELDIVEERAALDEAWARVREVDSELEYLKKEERRSQLLYGGHVVAEAEHARAAQAVQNATRRKLSLLAAAARISKHIEKARIVAPRSGVVTSRRADAGEMVDAGEPLLTIANLDELRIEAEIGEFDTAHVRLGARATITAEGYGQRTWHAKVQEIPDTVVPRQLKPLDPASPVDTRVLLVKLAPTEKLPFKLGQRVEVTIAR